MANKHTAARFARLRTAIGWPSATLCRLVNCDPKTLWNWENAVREIPEEIMQWLEACAAALRQHPAPDYQQIRPVSGRKPEKETA